MARLSYDHKINSPIAVRGDRFTSSQDETTPNAVLRWTLGPVSSHSLTVTFALEGPPTTSWTSLQGAPLTCRNLPEKPDERQT